MAAHRLGQVEAYFTVREVLSEASTAADGALSRERSGFCRCRYATLGFRLVILINGQERRLSTKFELDGMSMYSH